MNLHADDPRLTAYLLGELSADETAAVANAAAADPAIGLALRDLEGTQRLLANAFSAHTDGLLPQQRSAVLRAARHADQADNIVAMPSVRRRSWHTLLKPVAAVALVVLSTMILIRLTSSPDAKTGKVDPNNADSWSQVPAEIALLPATGPRDPGFQASPEQAQPGSNLATRIHERDRAIATAGDEFLRQVAEQIKRHPAPSAGALPPLKPRGFVASADHPVMDLPIHAGRASLGWIAHSVREQKVLPAVHAVRLEEILNHFALRPEGGRGAANGVTLASEIIPLPWKPSSMLLVLTLTGAPDGSREVKAAFRADPSVTARYRLQGFATLGGASAGALPSRLPAKTVTSLAIEIEPTDSSGALGVIEWSVDGIPAKALPVAAHDSQTAASSDARFAALVCAFGQWLARDETSKVDAGMVAALARQTSATDLPADRRDFVKLIEETLALAAP